MQSSVIGSLSSLLLLAIALCSFLFYGVVGQDKTWLLAPAFLLTYGLVAVALWRKALGTRRWALEGDEPRTANCTRSEADSKNLQRSDKLPTAGELLLLFLLWGIAMIPQAAVPFESKLTMLFVGGVVGAYLVWGTELTAFKDNRILLGLLIFVVMLAAFYGLIVHFKCPDRVLWAERYAVYEGRLMSTYICPNHFAHLMQMLMPFCVALLFIPQAGIYLRLLSAYSFLAFLPPLYLTESRAGWLGTMAATGVVLCLMALRRSRKLFALLIILVPLCSILLLLGGWKYSETFQRRMKPVVEFLQHQSEEGVGSAAKDFRPQTWMDTIDMIREAPLIGFGPGNYRYTFPEHRKRFRGNRIVTGHPHNEYLELMADYGLVGFGLFALAWCYGLIRILIASLKAEETRHAFIGFAFIGTAAGTMVHSFFDFEMHVYPNALVFALLAALAWGPLARARKRKQLTADSGQHESGKAALECGGSTPLSVSHSARSAQNPVSVSHKEHKKTRNGDHIGQSVEGPLSVSDLTGADLTKSEQSASAMDSRVFLCFLWLKKAGAWLLAVGYLLGTLFCLQIMGSSFIRALGDKRAEASGTSTSGAVSSSLSADRLYILAARLDPQNWRACKGMGNLLFNQRYYSLEMDEKVMLAEQERGWYKKAYDQNPKDPEICMAYGKCLIFLGKNQGTGHSALGTRVDEITATGRSGGGTASSPSTDIGDDVPPDSDLKSIRQQPLAISQEQSEDGRQNTADSHQPAENGMQQTANFKLQTANSQISQGLDLLREACRYRPFNDVYWWNLGVELRKAGRYEEALEVFNRAASIKRTSSTNMNIVWLNARLKALGDRHEALGVGSAEEETALQINKVKNKEAEVDEWTILNPTNATVDRGLMNLLDKMGELEK